MESACFESWLMKPVSQSQLMLENVDVKGGDKVGTWAEEIATKSSVYIAQVYVTGSVQRTWGCGGFVGDLRIL